MELNENEIYTVSRIRIRRKGEEQKKKKGKAKDEMVEKTPKIERHLHDPLPPFLFP